jgi:hypothetical protein
LLTADGTSPSRRAADAILHSSQTAMNKRNEMGSKLRMPASKRPFLPSYIGTADVKNDHFRDG